jgi:para-aminobenzoate synthetase component 1
MVSLPYETRYTYRPDDEAIIKLKMLNWVQQFSIFVYLDNNNYQHEPNRFEALASFSPNATPISHIPNEASIADYFHFGHITYDHKNAIDKKLTSRHSSNVIFDECAFYRGDTVVYIPYGRHELIITSFINHTQDILSALLATEVPAMGAAPLLQWQHRFNKDDYIATVEAIRNHIIEGDCYELNLCAESFAENITLAPVELFQRLNARNPSPFACCYRVNHSYLIGASPERFLFRNDNCLISQPIKGTSKRGATPVEDEIIKNALVQNEKERAENVMITDLVRNDLAKSCIPGSINVPELCGLYTLPQVHQLISTVSGSVQKEVSTKQIIEHAFPMGSMTGAPKQIVMQLIDQYERSRRNIYSGTVGYILPNGNFDFNVNIRSLVYNAANGYLSYHAGGAITYDSVPEQEWEEIRLKARAMEQLFQ